MVVETLKEVESLISRKEKELANLQVQMKLLKEQDAVLTPAQKLAIVLHKKMCHHDHTEYCDWYYDVKNGVHDWTCRGEYGAHAQYLAKANAVLAAGFKPESVEKLLEII